MGNRRQKKLKIKMTRTNKKERQSKSSSSRPNTRNGGTLNGEGSAIGDSVFIKDGDSAFDM